jgi:hypothetical protein
MVHCEERGKQAAIKKAALRRSLSKKGSEAESCFASKVIED